METGAKQRGSKAEGVHVDLALTVGVDDGQKAAVGRDAEGDEPLFVERMIRV